VLGAICFHTAQGKSEARASDRRCVLWWMGQQGSGVAEAGANKPGATAVPAACDMGAS